MNEVRKELNAAIECTALDKEHALSAHFNLDSGFVGFRGHFPENPILPGVCIIAAVLVAVQKTLGKELKMSKLKFAKFFSPVRPNEPVMMKVTLTYDAQFTYAKAALSYEDRKFALVSLCCRQSSERA